MLIISSIHLNLTVIRKQKEEITRNKKNQLVKELSIGDMLMIRGGGDPPKEIRPVEPPVYL